MPVRAIGAARRSRRLLACAAGWASLALAALAPAALASDLVITITGVHSSSGNVVVALFNKPDGFPDGDFSIMHVTVKATTAPIVVSFDNLKPGAYAVGAYHDENGNRCFDTTWIGFPDEGYALSNGIRAVFSRPTFQEAAFAVNGDRTRVALQIRY